MNSLLPRFLCTTFLICLPLAAPPPAKAGPLRTLGAGLKKLNPFRKSEVQPAAEPPPAPSPKPKAAAVSKTTKTTKPAPVKKKKSPGSTTKKAATAPVDASGDNKSTTDASASKTSSSPDGDAPPATNTSETPPAADATPPPADASPAVPTEIPFGTPVMGRRGLVHSPYASEQGMVDVTDLPAGAKVKCPFTGKIFRVP